MIIQPFTEKPPTNCPKCGGTEIRRIYSDYSPRMDVWIPFLVCSCQTCGYDWPQHTKDFKEEK